MRRGENSPPFAGCESGNILKLPAFIKSLLASLGHANKLPVVLRSTLGNGTRGKDRKRFFAAAAEAMRRILVENVR